MQRLAESRRIKNFNGQNWNFEFAIRDSKFLRRTLLCFTEYCLGNVMLNLNFILFIYPDVQYALLVEGN